MIDQSRIAGFGVGPLADKCKENGIAAYDLCSVFSVKPEELDFILVDRESFNLRCREEVDDLIKRWGFANKDLHVLEAHEAVNLLEALKIELAVFRATLLKVLAIAAESS